MNSQAIWREFEQLPPERQQEVADYIAFLASREIKAVPKRRNRKRSILKEPFFGMWKDREDMRDSVEWVRELRRREWSR